MTQLVERHRTACDRFARGAALFAALDEPGALDRTTELPGGGRSAPQAMLAALTTDVLVHTWDLARSAGLDPALDPALCAAAYDAIRHTDLGATDMYAPAVPTAGGADAVTKLIAYCGRDPEWAPAGG